MRNYVVLNWGAGGVTLGMKASNRVWFMQHCLFRTMLELAVADAIGQPWIHRNDLERENTPKSTHQISKVLGEYIHQADGRGHVRIVADVKLYFNDHQSAWPDADLFPRAFAIFRALPRIPFGGPYADLGATRSAEKRHRNQERLQERRRLTNTAADALIDDVDESARPG